METLTQTSPETAEALRTLAAGQLRWSLSHILKTLAATPDDKLDFKPSESASSTRELVQHIISGNGHVGRVLGLDFSGEPPTDRDALVARVTETTEAIIGALEALTPEQIDSTIDFFGPMPMKSFMLVDHWHISRHAGQIDYIQTIYGDMEDHF